MDSLHSEFIDRPFMETGWRSLCDFKIKVYVYEHGQNAETDKMLYRCSFAENQVCGLCFAFFPSSPFILKLH
jgi:hypothetical protein